jgi:uncharacterized protein
MSIDWSAMLKTWGAAFALYLIIEGIMPFVNPSGFKRLMKSITQLGDRQLRVMGLISMLSGVLLLYCLRS